MLHILHLVGSPTSAFYHDLSVLYARDCIEAIANPRRYRFLIALVTPGGQWRFPLSLQTQDIASAPPMPLSSAIDYLASHQIDLALPQMFCLPGMTDYRALLDLLQIPYIGNRPMQMAIAADKSKAKAIVAAANVCVPKGECLKQLSQPTIVPPAVVKPNASDNSMGVSFVEHASDYREALQSAFEHDSSVIVEEYIPLGREVRCGIVESDDELVCLPLEEYIIDNLKNPIRTQADKLSRDKDDQLTLMAKSRDRAWILPADDPIVKPTWEAAKQCHRALGCRHYSLFDFRIDPDGKPVFMEAGLYCSFSPKSVLVCMMAANGKSIADFFQQSLEQALTKDMIYALPH